jgi:hypothetical protein
MLRASLPEPLARYCESWLRTRIPSLPGKSRGRGSRIL